VPGNHFSLISGIPASESEIYFSLEITFLGTGTSQGVPVIGCDCEVCQSGDPRDKRLRTSALINIDGIHLAIDAGPDFRQQMLRADVERLDGILGRHEHNDHIIGLDDVRPFNFRYKQKMPVYASERVQKSLLERFDYAFAANPYPGAPGFELHSISKEEPFLAKGVSVQPLEVIHGKLPVLGFRIHDFTYITDAKFIAEEELEKARHSKVLVLNALHHRPHYSHLNLEQALEVIEKLEPEKAYLTHISHYMGLHERIDRTLPENVSLAYDGLKIKLVDE
jgi:phosphoribosyl 1,2-cyclic phosphate phosphodiesterase